MACSTVFFYLYQPTLFIENLLLPQDPALWDATPCSLVDRYEPTRCHIPQNYNRNIHSIQNILPTVHAAVLRCGAGESWLECRDDIGGNNSFLTINLRLLIHHILEEIFSWHMDCTLHLLLLPNLKTQFTSSTDLWPVQFDSWNGRYHPSLSKLPPPLPRKYDIVGSSSGVDKGADNDPVFRNATPCRLDN